MPGSCSSGFRSRPCAGTGNSRRNGFDANSTNSMKPAASRPITPSTRARTGSGSWRPKPGHGQHPQRLHQHPQQHRALVRAPGRGEAVQRRQHRVGVLGHVAHREVARAGTRPPGRPTTAPRTTPARRPGAAPSPSTAHGRARRRPAAARRAAAPAGTRGSIRSGRFQEASKAVVAARRRGARDYRTPVVTDARHAPTGSTGCAPRSASPGCR